MLFLPAGRFAVRSLVWSPTENFLAAGGDDRGVRLWRLASRELLHHLEGHTRSVYAVGFAPDGESLISCGGDGQIRLWSTRDGAMRTTPPVHVRSVNCLAVDRRGTVVTADGAWRSTSRAIARRLHRRGRPGNHVELRANGPSLVLHGREVSSVAISPDGVTVAAGTPDLLLHWTPRREPAHAIPWAATAPGRQPDANIMVSGELSLIAAGAWFRAVAFSPDGRQLAAAADAQVRIWPMDGGSPLTLSARGGMVTALAYSTLGGLIAAADEGGSVGLWSTVTGTERVRFAWNIGAIYSLAFSPDGAALAAGGEGQIVVWDVGEYY